MENIKHVQRLKGEGKMIVAVLITSHSREFAFTPESEEEKTILDFLPNGERLVCSVRTGPFYIAGKEKLINHDMDDTTMLIFGSKYQDRGRSKKSPAVSIGAFIPSA